MPVRYLSDPELARLSGWPDEIADVDAVTYFTLSDADVSWLAGFNRQHNRLGVAVQLSTLPWLGWIPDDLASCPPMALDRLAEALAIAPETSSTLLTEYGGWQGETRRKHRGRVLDRLGWRLCGAGERKLLDEFLLARALEHDAPGVLLRLACDWLRAESIVRPPVDSLLVGSPQHAMRHEPRPITGSGRCCNRRVRCSSTACSMSTLTSASPGWRGCAAGPPSPHLSCSRPSSTSWSSCDATAPTRWICPDFRPDDAAC